MQAGRASFFGLNSRGTWPEAGGKSGRSVLPVALDAVAALVLGAFAVLDGLHGAAVQAAQTLVAVLAPHRLPLSSRMVPAGQSRAHWPQPVQASVA